MKAFEDLQQWLPEEVADAERGIRPMDLMNGESLLRASGIAPEEREAILNGNLEAAAYVSKLLTATSITQSEKYGIPASEYTVADTVTYTLLTVPVGERLPLPGGYTESSRGRYFNHLRAAVADRLGELTGNKAGAALAEDSLRPVITAKNAA